MKLIKELVVAASATNVGIFCQMIGIDPKNVWERDVIAPKLPKELLPAYADTLDFAVTLSFAKRAETIIFGADHILSFLKGVNRKLRPGDYPCPFDSFFLQFSHPIEEKLFLHGAFTSGAPPMNNDNVLGLLVCAPEEGGTVMNVIAFYQSTAINRVAVDIESGELVMQPLLGLITKEGWEDKQRIVNLGLLCIAYINSPKIVIEKIAADPKVNQKREKKGKRKLDPYYICHLRDTKVIYPEGANTQRTVSRMFPVIGHFRQLPDGKITWVRSHYRGVEHGPESMKNKVYQVGGDVDL